MDKGFLLMSGGLDSTTLAYQLKNGNEIAFEGLFIDYGQPTAKEEFDTVINLANQLEIPVRRVDLSTVWGNFEDSGLDPYAAACTETANIFAPLLMAATFAYAAGGTKLYSAFHKTDAELFPSTIAVLKAQDDIMKSVSQHNELPFEFVLPFINYTKAEVVGIGSKLNVPFEDTLTCLSINKNKEGHCGNCNPCIHRKKAFDEAKVIDKTSYLN